MYVCPMLGHTKVGMVPVATVCCAGTPAVNCDTASSVASRKSWPGSGASRLLRDGEPLVSAGHSGGGWGGAGVPRTHVQAGATVTGG